MKTLLLSILLTLALTGCNATVEVTDKRDKPATPSVEEPAGPTSETENPDETDEEVVTETPEDDGAIRLTIYSLTKVIASIHRGDTVETLTGTGSCVVIESDTFCWDDGTKRFPALGVAVQYWGIDATMTRCPNINNDCESDLLAVPTLMTTNIIAVLNTAFGTSRRSVNEVLSSGTAREVSCTDDGGVYDCGDFTVDTKQVPR